MRCDLALFFDLQRAHAVVRFERRERLDEERLPARARVVNDARQAAGELRLDRNDEAPVANRDDAVLNRFGVLRRASGSRSTRSRASACACARLRRMRPSAGEARSSTAPRSSIASTMARCSSRSGVYVADDVREIGMLADGAVRGGRRRDGVADRAQVARRRARGRPARPPSAPPFRPRGITCKIAAGDAATRTASVRAARGARASKSVSGEQLAPRAPCRARFASRRRRDRARRRNRAPRACARSARRHRDVLQDESFSLHQLVDERRIGLAARGLHHLTDEEARDVALSRLDSRRRRFAFAASTSSTKRSIAPRSLVCASPSRSTIAAGEPAPSHMRVEQLLGDLRVDALAFDQRDQLGQMLGRDVRIGHRRRRSRWRGARGRRGRSCSTAAGCRCSATTRSKYSASARLSISCVAGFDA